MPTCTQCKTIVVLTIRQKEKANRLNIKKDELRTMGIKERKLLGQDNGNGSIDI